MLRSQVVALETLGTNAFETFRIRFRHKPPLPGNGERLLENKNDILALQVRKEPDRLSAFVRNNLGYYLRVSIGLALSPATSILANLSVPGRPKGSTPIVGPVYYYSDAVVAKIIVVISLLVAAFLLIAAVVALYFIQSPGSRLGVVGVFTLIFAGSVGLLTNARGSEVFGATLA